TRSPLAAIDDKPADKFMIRSRARIREAAPGGDWSSADANALHFRLAREMFRLALELDLDLADVAHLGWQCACRVAIFGPAAPCFCRCKECKGDKGWSRRKKQPEPGV